MLTLVLASGQLFLLAKFQIGKRMFCEWINRLNEDIAMGSVQSEVSDDISRVQRQQRLRRVRGAMGVFALCMGLFAFFSVAGNARFESYHKLDVIRLMTAGVGIGVALVVLIQFFNLPSPSTDSQKQ